MYGKICYAFHTIILVRTFIVLVDACDVIVCIIVIKPGPEGNPAKEVGERVTGSTSG